jgi:ABC-type sugar transport system ATPase subunit
LRGVSKGFPGVLAVDGVNLDILPGEVHVVAGENGAGKSTLMKLLSQVERPSEGEIEFSGEKMEFHGPRYAQALGIAMVYQEFALAPDLSVAENLFMGHEPGRFGFVSRGAEKEKARELLGRVGLVANPDRLAGSLTVAEQQRLEIAKALAIEARIVIMDEPTATLAEREIEDLFGVIRDLTADGIAILYISHRLDEIFRIADRVTVMRDGRVVDTLPVSELNEDGLVRLMVGREVGNLYPKPEAEIGDVLLRASGVSRGGVLKDCQLGMDQNITLANLPSRFGFLSLGAERRTARRRRDELNIRTPSIRRSVQVLSGGNQQKVVVAKWLETEAKVLFFDEPARGIDVGAKAEMFGLIGDLAKEGRGTVLISSYLPELLNMCDRILVMREGEVAGVIPREEFSEERVISLATGTEEAA